MVIERSKEQKEMDYIHTAFNQGYKTMRCGFVYTKSFTSITKKSRKNLLKTLMCKKRMFITVKSVMNIQHGRDDRI